MKTHVSAATEARAIKLNILHPTFPIMVGGDGTIKPNRRENTRSDDNVTLQNITCERNPHRFYTVTRFENMFTKKSSKSPMRKTREYQSGSPIKARNSQESDLKEK